MIQKFFNLKLSTNGQKLYEFTEKTLEWIKKNQFNNGLIKILADAARVEGLNF